MTDDRTPLEHDVPRALASHPSVRSVRLVGSRARGTSGPLSDWDFAIDTADFAALAHALPELVAPLKAVAQQWDPLSAQACYMLILPGPMKVDLIFAERHESSPPWTLSPETLPAIDSHFWDWLYWLASKHVVGEDALVAEEFTRMHRHLLGPLGADFVPGTIEAAARSYLELRRLAEERLAVAVPRALECEIRRGLSAAGFEV